jgi:hypothetical protein
LEFVRSKLTVVYTNATFVVKFEKARYEPLLDDSIVLRPGDANEKPFTWVYHNVTTAVKIEDVTSDLTRNNLRFQKVERGDFDFQVGQKGWNGCL